MRNIVFLLSVFLAMIIASYGYAFDFDRDDSSGMKVSLTSLPFFNEDKDGPDRSGACNKDYDPDDQEYEVDTIGRKVPVRTRKAGTAITTR